jgi:condensin complex subunit 2
MDTFALDFAQDPLFQKTAADFDQGGATGLLLSILDISEQGSLIFGASSTLDQLPTPTEEICDLSGLQARFGARFGNINDQVICPTFQKFMFNSNDVIEEFNMNFENRNDFFYEPADISSIDTAENHDDRMEHMDESMGMDMDSHVFDPQDFHEESTESQMVQENIMKMIHGTTINQNKYLYFDNIKGSQWVGPEHWKSRILNTTTTTKTRIKKTKVPIDFNSEVDPASIFQKTKTTLLLPKATLESKQLNLLGVDKQFNSKRFTQMFLKPEYNVL